MTMPVQKPGKSRQDYGTPLDLLAAVRERLVIDDFVCDLAASVDNTVCPVYISEEQDSLVSDWPRTNGGWCWLNPPYKNIEPWVAKAVASTTHCQTAMLVPASVGSNWWNRYVDGFAYQLFLNPRLTFVGQTDAYPKDCALLLYTNALLTGNQVWRWK